MLTCTHTNDSTQSFRYALVQNNVAYRVMGHTYFVEDGDEEYVTLEGNLGIETLTSPYSLKSDCQASTFWTATPKNIWRNNVAANSHGNGFWFELDAGAFGDTSNLPTIEVSGNSYHDNNLRGWFIAPNYEPDTPQYFHNNTYARNHMDGVFYGVGGDTHHIGDRFASNSGNGDINWWFFPSQHKSRWIPNLKDVTYVGGRWDCGKGARVLPPLGGAALFAPNDEFFLVDGAEFVDYGDRPTITQCFDCCGYRSRQGAYTTRFSRMSFHNSNVRTTYTCPEKQIFFDLDGSLSDEAPGTSVIAYHAFNDWPECSTTDDQSKMFGGGLVCNNTVRVRKVGIPVYGAKKFSPYSNFKEKVYIKPSELVNPLGFTAVFETPRNHSRGGYIPPFEKPYLLSAIAAFLGLGSQHVKEGPFPPGYAQNLNAKNETIGMAVVIGGHLDLDARNDDSGRTRVQVSHDAICGSESGTIVTSHEDWLEDGACASKGGWCACTTAVRFGLRSDMTQIEMAEGQTGVTCDVSNFPGGLVDTSPAVQCYCKQPDLQYKSYTLASFWKSASKVGHQDPVTKVWSRKPVMCTAPAEMEVKDMCRAPIPDTSYCGKVQMHSDSNVDNVVLGRPGFELTVHSATYASEHDVTTYIKNLVYDGMLEHHVYRHGPIQLLLGDAVAATEQNPSLWDVVYSKGDYGALDVGKASDIDTSPTLCFLLTLRNIDGELRIPLTESAASHQCPLVFGSKLSHVY